MVGDGQTQADGQALPLDAPHVALLDTSEEATELLRLALNRAGLRTVAAFTTDFKRGRQEMGTFLANYDPPVLVWDIAIPYAENWAFYERTRDSDRARGRAFVLTTFNKEALESFVGETPTIELIGLPDDVDRIVDAVRRALGGAREPR